RNVASASSEPGRREADSDLAESRSASCISRIISFQSARNHIVEEVVNAVGFEQARDVAGLHRDTERGRLAGDILIGYIFVIQILQIPLQTRAVWVEIVDGIASCESIIIWVTSIPHRVAVEKSAAFGVVITC